MSGPMRCPKCSCPLDQVRLPEAVTIESCPNCFGAYYDRSELAVLIELSGARDTATACPKCESPMQAGRYRGQLELEQCRKCHGLWFDSGEIQKLRQLSGVEGIVKGAGTEPAPAEPIMTPAAMAAFVERLETQRQQVKAAAAHEKTAKPEKYSAALDIPDGGHQDNPDESRSPAVEYQKRRYEHFQTSWPVVTYVVGEFPWKIRVGEKAAARDFVHPPYIISQEVSGKDSVWSHGEYVEPGEVAAAFKLQNPLPGRSGVAPAQPNPYAEAHAASTKTFWTLAAAAVAVAAVLAIFSSGERVLEQQFGHLYAAPEKSVVTSPFELKGHTSNVEVSLNTNLHNQWAYFSMALINAETDVALDFGREVAYYTGVDEDGAWREGSQTDTTYVPMVPPGQYYLRIEPETDAGQFAYTVRVRRDVTRPSLLVFALLLLVLPIGWVWWAHRSFEQSRWMESDHPWTSYEGDDDDE